MFASIGAGYLSNKAFSLQKGGFSLHPVSRRMDIWFCVQKWVEWNQHGSAPLSLAIISFPDRHWVCPQWPIAEWGTRMFVTTHSWEAAVVTALWPGLFILVSLCRDILFSQLFGHVLTIRQWCQQWGGKAVSKVTSHFNSPHSNWWRVHLLHVIKQILNSDKLEAV